MVKLNNHVCGSPIDPNINKSSLNSFVNMDIDCKVVSIQKVTWGVFLAWFFFSFWIYHKKYIIPFYTPNHVTTIKSILPINYSNLARTVAEWIFLVLYRKILLLLFLLYIYKVDVDTNYLLFLIYFAFRAFLL